MIVWIEIMLVIAVAIVGLFAITNSLDTQIDGRVIRDRKSSRAIVDPSFDKGRTRIVNPAFDGRGIVDPAFDT